jgi:hypothetical protein
MADGLEIPVTPSREAEIAAHGPTLPESQRQIAQDYGHGWLAGHSKVEQLESENASILAQLQQARALTLDLVIEELDRVVMPRDVWVEMRARLDMLRALSPTPASDYMQQVQRAEQAEAALQQAREALAANRDEIRQQAGAHYTGCNCTFCSVIARTDAALHPDTLPEPPSEETRCTVCRMEYPRTGQQTGPIWEIIGKGFRICRRCRGAGLDAKRAALKAVR